MINTRIKQSSSNGFSLVEMLISIAVLAVLVSIAMPSFRTWLQNIQVRNSAESILSGIQRARAEAVGRNTSISFVMAADSSWTVNVVAPASVIETRPASEGSENVTRIEQPTGATTVTFGSLGIVVPNPASLTQVELTASGGNKKLWVTIGVGGNAKIEMCDPSLPTGSSPSAC